MVARTLAALREEGLNARPVATTAAGSATAIARECVGEGADLIIALGGDGTINEVANGMIGSPVPLAILPGGTANCLAQELGFGSRLERAVHGLAHSHPERIAVGKLRNAAGERHFLLMAGAGLDAGIVYTVHAGLKGITGKGAYWLGGMKALTQPLAQFHTHVNERPYTTGFALASRVKNYGGDLSIATGASLLSPDFEVVLFEGRNPLRYWTYFAGVITGTLPRFAGVTVTRSRKLDIAGANGERVYVQVDGEYAGNLPASIEIVDDALTLLLPDGFREKHAV